MSRARSSSLTVPPRASVKAGLALAIAAVVSLGAGPSSNASAASSPTASTTTTFNTAAVQNGTYRVLCDANPAATPQTVTLVNGTAQDPRGPDFGTVSLRSIQRFDVTGDTKPETVLEIVCAAGANAAVSNVIIVTDTPAGPSQIGMLPGQRPGPDTTTPGQLVLWIAKPSPGDPRCCPSQYTRAVYAYRSGAFALVNSETRSAADFAASTTTTSPAPTTVSPTTAPVPTTKAKTSPARRHKRTKTSSTTAKSNP